MQYKTNPDQRPLVLLLQLHIPLFGTMIQIIIEALLFNFVGLSSKLTWVAIAIGAHYTNVPHVA